MMGGVAREIAAWLPGPLLACFLIFGEATAQNVPAAEAAPAAMPAQSLQRRLLDDIERDITSLRPWLDRYGYGAVFAAVGVEGIGMPAPGQSVLIAGALAAAAKTRIRIVPLLATAFLASVLGSSLGYLIGRHGGRRLLVRFPAAEGHLRRVEQGFTRYGGGLIVVARFVDGLRQLNGFVAGMLGMPWWTFTLYNALGAGLWVGCWGLGIYFLDEHWSAVLGLVRRANPWVAVAALAGVMASVAIAWLRRGPQDR
jgi:membrane protein DedA with SNARE-associated domain